MVFKAAYEDGLSETFSARDIAHALKMATCPCHKLIGLCQVKSDPNAVTRRIADQVRALPVNGHP